MKVHQPPNAKSLFEEEQKRKALDEISFVKFVKKISA